MIISLIIFICSGILLGIFWFGKKSELKGGRALIRVGSDLVDKKISDTHDRYRIFISNIDSVYIKNKLHDIAESTEKFGLKIAQKIVIRFTKIKEAAQGKDLPKNRGSVSFFLRHIVKHKDGIDKNTRIR